MKIILLKDIPKTGKRYETKEVADGFALNSLIPRGLAIPATADNVKRVSGDIARETAEKKIHEDLLIKNLKDIDGQTITITGKANEKGHLFAALHSDMLVKEIQKQTRVQLQPDHIVIEKPLKEVGEHSIKVKVGDKSATFKLVIEAK